MPFSFFTLFPHLHTGPFASFLRRTALHGRLWVSDGNKIVTFVCLKMSLFRPHCWRISTEYLRSAVALYKHYRDVTPRLLASIVHVRKSAVWVMAAPSSATCLFAVAAFEVFSLSLIFRTLNRMCLAVTSFVFILLGICSACWTFGLISLINFEKSRSLFLQRLLSLTVSLLSLWDHRSAYFRTFHHANACLLFALPCIFLMFQSDFFILQ